jgi:hypothetical protein
MSGMSPAHNRMGKAVNDPARLKVAPACHFKNARLDKLVMESPCVDVSVKSCFIREYPQHGQQGKGHETHTKGL